MTRPAGRQPAGEAPPAPAGRGPVDPLGEATLELFASSPAYNDFLWRSLTALAPIEGRVLEVGCGIGTITARILASPGVTAVHAIDLDASYVGRVLAGLGDPRLSGTACRIEDFVPERCAEAGDARYDRVVSSNVLEHVEDDRAAMRSFARMLADGGRALILVPAHRWLFSDLDRNLAHFRRYERRDLEGLAGAAGLELEKVRYFNPLGVLGWWVNGKLLRRQALPAGQLRAYGRFAVPVSAFLDRINPLPLGISVLGCFRKGAGPPVAGRAARRRAKKLESAAELA